ncbi:MAG: ABC transporter permease [Bacteroidetes bacterium]|nr:ABC transporter permease [Bacteroidota bacterium]
MSHKEEGWDIVVKQKSSSFNLNIREIWGYKDLILLLVKRDITSIYKQTILGPLWMFVQPVFTTAIYTFTFSYSAKLSTDGIPPVLFYLIGQVFWTYFADCLNKTANTFVSNASVFGKVYFPRLVMPISVVISNLLKLGIQLMLLIAVYLFVILILKQDITVQWKYILLLPFLVVFMGVFGLGLGILFSSYTTKYRDFTFLLGFAVQLLMFGSCVVFPVTMYSAKIQSFLMFNPVVAYLEAIKFVLTGHGHISLMYILVDTIAVAGLLFMAMLKFNKTEKSFMDTV